MFHTKADIFIERDVVISEERGRCSGRELYLFWFFFIIQNGEDKKSKM